MTRDCSVAGLFYESNYDKLNKEISNIFSDVFGKDIDFSNSNNNKNIVSAVVPHAGYVYSGKTASHVFKEIAEDGISETIIIIGPNHTGMGNELSITKENKWMTPLGDILIDNEFRKELLNFDNNLSIDELAHLKEHSIEVELPFLQYISNIQNKTFKLVPIIIQNQIPDLCINLARNIKKTADKLNKNVTVIASTDLTHYETSTDAKFKDEKVMKSIREMDINQLVNDIITYDITMCGYGPTIVAIYYAKLSNAMNSQILDYSNSGDAFGDYSSVVGYTSAIIKK